MTFNDLKLSAPLLKAVSEAGYETPSPIQASAIPPVLEGRDLMGCAQTGTGKTAAFALPMLDRLSAAAPRRKGAVRALILTPTRELALQIGESFDAYGKYLKLRSTVIFGGVGQAPQVEAIRKGVDILILFIKYQLPALWKNTQTLYALIQLIHQHPCGFFISQLISDISDILSDILFRTLSQGEMVLTVHIPS